MFVAAAVPLHVLWRNVEVENQSHGVMLTLLHVLSSLTTSEEREEGRNSFDSIRIIIIIRRRRE